MTKSNLKIIIIISLVLPLASCFSTGSSKKSGIHGSMDYLTDQFLGLPAPVGPFEGPQTFTASSLLPANVITGANYSIQPQVNNDGFLNIYTINSSYGNITAVSTATLYKRVHEMKVIAEIEKMSKSGEFVDGVTEKGKDVVKGAKNAGFNPIDTVTGSISGIGKMFNRVKENAGNQAKSDSENILEDASGYSKTKRDYANELKVDVYSRNPILQEELDNLAMAGYAGNMLSALTIGNFTGPVATATGTANLLNKAMKDMSPPDLRIMNREKLKKMGVLNATADAFIKNGSYTPREQTVLVNALFEMKNTQGRDEFIKFATPADHYDVTYFRQLQAEMYADHNRNIAPIKQFRNLGPFTTAITEDNVLNVCLPMDYLLWTSGMAKAVTILTGHVNTLPRVKEKRFYLIGSLSPVARKNLTKLGWVIFDKTAT